MVGREELYVAPPVGNGVVAPATPPTFSVIVPCYQAADTVGDAVASVLGQTRPPHEVIVCDDGSTDAPAEALAPYLDRIVFLSQENGGVASARNLGLRHATGEFVVVCDADDIYLPTLLEELAALGSDRPDLDILCYDFFVEAEGAVLGRARSDPASFVTDDQRVGILREDFVPGCSAFRRTRLLNEGGYDESLRCAEDWDSWIRLILGGAAAGLVYLPLAQVRIRPGSLSASLPRVLAGQEAVLRKALSRPDLSTTERDAARRHLAQVAPARQLAQARDAIRDGTPAEIRRRCLPIVWGRGQGMPSRGKALTAAAAPRLAQRRARREPAGDHRVGPLGA